MLGVPTRTDAMELSPEYAQAIHLEELGQELGSYRDIFSTMYANNHVIGAYREAGVTDFSLPKSGQISDIDPESVPVEVNDRLQPDLVRAQFTDRIVSYRGVLFSAQASLDVDTPLVIQTANHSRFTDLSDGVAVEECTTDRVFTDTGFVYSEGDGRGWRYTFNPFRLANQALGSFEDTLASVRELEPTRFLQIVGMMLSAEDAAQTSSSSLLKSVLRASPERSSLGFENDPLDPVGALVKENEKLTRKSDLHLRFDEWCFVAETARGLAMIPANCVLEGGGRMSFSDLSHRASLRQIIDQTIQQRGEVVINNVTYEPVYDAPDDSITGYLTDGQPYQALVNLLGKPAQRRYPGGQLTAPEEWAAEEVVLAKAFAEDHDPVVATMLLKRYEMECTFGHSSKARALDQLAYSLGPGMLGF